MKCLKCGVRTNVLSTDSCFCLDCQKTDYPIIEDIKKDRSLREYAIEKILEQHDPDQILIDLLCCDLFYLAEKELENASTDKLIALMENH